MANTVFVLGAGASSGAGTPLMNNFLDRARELSVSGAADAYGDSFKQVLDAVSKLQLVHSKSQLDIHNVESVFAAFEMAKTLSTFADYGPEQIEALSRAMIRLIVGTIQETFRVPVHNHAARAPYPYPEFAALVAGMTQNRVHKRSVAIITFNYDMALDLALYFNNTLVRYGLQQGERPDAIPLLKLHGSLNWARCAGCTEVVPWYLSDYFSRYRWSLDQDRRFVWLPIASNFKTLRHGEHTVQNEPMIVPPTWNKAHHHQEISRVWSFAARELSEAENIVVIGYSLPQSDMFFRLLYALGTVASAPLDRFWVVNPDASGEVKNRFQAILGPGAAARFQYLEKDFASSLPEISRALVAQ
jgi:hypothetical protein